MPAAFQKGKLKGREYAFLLTDRITKVKWATTLPSPPRGTSKMQASTIAEDSTSISFMDREWRRALTSSLMENSKRASENAGHWSGRKVETTLYTSAVST